MDQSRVPQWELMEEMDGCWIASMTNYPFSYFDQKREVFFFVVKEHLWHHQ